MWGGLSKWLQDSRQDKYVELQVLLLESYTIVLPLVLSRLHVHEKGQIILES